MKAVTYNPFAWHRSVREEEVPTPSPKKGEILLDVRATCMNGSDKEMFCGTPAYARIYGWVNARKRILGSDVAGVVEAVGDGVTAFKPGDRVVGELMDIFGGFGEKLCAPATRFVALPEGLDFVRASAIPQSGTIAMQAIGGYVNSGDRVLINGAGGGAGSFAIQLAKQAGAHVTAVDTGLKADGMRAMGADRVIDYTNTDFAEQWETYDVILDLFGTRPTRAVRKALTPRGRYMLVGGSMRAMFGILIGGALARLTSSQKIGVLGWKARPEDISALCDRVARGKLQVQIGETFEPKMLVVAIATMQCGNVAGNLVILRPGPDPD